MRVLILALGTRGDFELFVVLARALAARGHHVTLASSGFYERAARAAALEFLALGQGTHGQLLAVLRAMNGTADRIERTRMFATRWLQPQLAQAREMLSAAGAGSDYFVSNLKLVLQQGGEVLPGAFVTYDPPAAVEELARYGSRRHGGRILELVALPRRLADPDGSWGEEFHFTGFWHAATPPKTPEPGLAQFVAAGPPPIVLTLGSMLSADVEALLGRFAEALAASGQRGVVVAGWSRPILVPPHLCLVQEADYDWLFARAACVVHHGGVGTLAAVLRAGKPSILLPQIYAQALFARWLEREGLTAGVFEAADLTPRDLASAMRRAVEDQALLRRAAAWSDGLRGERGADLAAELIEQHWQHPGHDGGTVRP
jgi:O-mycaminosyltylonolide 6-deoxyallosyltransferase